MLTEAERARGVRRPRAESVNGVETIWFRLETVERILAERAAAQKPPLPWGSPCWRDTGLTAEQARPI